MNNQNWATILSFRLFTAVNVQAARLLEGTAGHTPRRLIQPVWQTPLFKIPRLTRRPHKRFFMSSPLSSYSVRPATARDAKAIADIHVATWKAAYSALMPEDFLKAMTVEKRLAFWKEAIEYSEPQTLVAVADNQVMGFVGFDRSRDPGTRSTVGEIWALYMAPGHMRQGGGVALWDGARDGLKEEGCTQVTAWVLLNNAPGMSFFEHSAGFKREMPSLRTTAFGTARLEEIRLKRAVD